MPYRWTDPDAEKGTLILVPHQSMTAKGFAWFIVPTAILFSLPLVALLGTPVLWGILPFIVAATWGVMHAIERNRQDKRVREELTLSPERIALIRHEPSGRAQCWDANPYWVSVQIYPGERPVEAYLTLRGNGREVEVGAFLSPEERRALHGELGDRLARVRAAV